MNEPLRVIPIGPAEADQRLDRFLRKLLRQVPLGAIFKHLRSGRIRVDGRKAKPELRLLEGMTLELRLPDADLPQAEAAAVRRAEPGQRRRSSLRPRVVYRDDDVVVVDKPAGLAMQSDGHSGDSLVGWLDYKQYGVRTATFAPAPAHRLDRGTSGLVAIGLTPVALRGLTRAFREGEVDKRYLAVVHGAPEASSGTIDAPLANIEGALGHEPKMRVVASGRPARTDYEVLRSHGDRALLALQLHSGRTHQIRAHLRHLGCPIVGDRRYGESGDRSGRMLLHAVELALPHPTREKTLNLRAEPGPEFGLGKR
ncbi:MAG: RluA family pseudouridine synthase [Planctomycetota bacterium]|nr:RluA family pseudouridine synthase [Planctomycetota bacterium]